MMESSNEFVEIFAGEPWQAAVVKDLLEDNGINAFIENGLMGSIAPWQVTPGGAGSAQVKIFASDYDVAKELVNSFTNGSNPLPENWDAE